MAAFASAIRTQNSSQGISRYGRRAVTRPGPGLNQLAQGGIKPEPQLDHLQDTLGGAPVWMAEAVAVLGSVPEVRGLIVGGSMGRGDPWPLSDIDVLPIYATGGDHYRGPSCCSTPDP
jgi:hypothetical protein